MSAFSRSEYLERLRRTKRRMQERGLDALLVVSPENINYLTGYEGWSFYCPELLAVTAEREEPVLYLRAMDIPCVQQSAFLSADSVVGYPEEWVGSPDRHAMTYIARELRERGIDGGVVGVEMDTAFFTARYYEELVAGLPSATFVDAARLVNRVRAVKSDAEIDYMRQAASLADDGMRAAFEAIEPGVRECDAAGAVIKAMHTGSNGFGGSFPHQAYICAGDKARAPHLTPTDDPFPSGTHVCVELGGCRFRYNAALARTFFLGSPPKELMRVTETVLAGFDEALDTMRPGATCEDVAATYQRVLREAGYRKDERLGYGIGLGFHPTWIELSASLQKGDKTVLEPNMTFHLLCGMWKGEHNTQFSETVRVTDGPPEVLTSFPRELLAKS